ncbi:MAG: hypothetical protein DMF87_03155 [Acidobacteria bacterium]|nr:MAG: hypothetical protein DMF87_03155 [Acidobacteriota bacterium]
MKHSVRGVLMAVFVLLAADGIARAQATAQLDGTVRDESGGVLPGVTVTVTQTDTGFIRSVVTETNGSYVLPNLPTGPYRLDVALQGFRTHTQTGIVLQVGGMPTINVVLAVGSLQETVSVEGAAPLVDVRTSGIRDVVEQAKIVELPLQGRNVTDLIMLAGSAVNTGKVLSNLNRNDGVAIAIAGGLRTGVAYTLDGALNSDFYDNTNLPFPFPDALQEFSVATSGQAAASGMHSSASVNAVTKSGTNSLHGNGFEFLRDSRFNAPSYFAPAGADGSKQKDGLNRNQFGGTLGGPVVRDKLFFFVAYQRTRSRQLSNDNLAFVPTAAMMAGDFTTAVSPACNNGRQVTLRAPFVNNRVAPAAFSPAALAIMRSGWIPSSGDPCGQMRFAVPLDDNNGQGVTRIDYQLTANHSVFGRYLDHIEQRPATLERMHNLLVVRNIYGPKSRKRAQTSALGDTMVFGSHAVNAIRATYVRTSTRSNAPADKFFDAPSLGIPIYTYVPGVLAVSITNGFAFSGGSSVAGVVDNRAYQAQDDFSRVAGAHQLSVGANLAYATLDSFDYANAAGNFAFNGSLTGSGLGDFLTGQASTLTHGTPSILHNYQWYTGVYGQDAWRASDRLTLNVGLRWEPYRWLPEGEDWHEQAVGESVAASRRRLGRHRRRPPRGAIVVRHQLRSSHRNLPAGACVGGAVRQPPHADREHPLRRSVSQRARRAAAPGACTAARQHRVSRPRLLRRDRSEHQLDASAVVERHSRTAGRHLVAGGRKLPGHVSRPDLGTGSAQSGHLHGTRAVHAARRELRVLFDGGQHRRAPGLLAGERRGRAEAVVCVPIPRHRDAELPGLEAVIPAPCGAGCEPRRQLHRLALHD